MEDFGDIIFYLIAAAVGIIGAIGRRKVKKGQQKTTIQKMETVVEKDLPVVEHEFDRHAEEIIIEEENVGVEEPAASAELDDKEKHVLTPSSDGAYDIPLVSDYAWEGVSAFEDMVVGADLVDANVTASESDIITETDTSDEGSYASELADEFDLRDAIIYSEIINRKGYV
jgi:hypothetical protein